MAKKIDAKVAEKAKVSSFVSEALTAAGYAVDDGTDYGMTAGTLVLKAGSNGLGNDLQVKFISPKRGETSYEKEEVEE